MKIRNRFILMLVPVAFFLAVLPITQGQTEHQKAQEEARGRKVERPKREFIELKVGDQDSFRLFVGESRAERVQGIVPVKGAAEESYIRIKPRRSDDAIIVETFLVVGHLGPAGWCEEVDKLPNIHVATELLKRGESKRLGVPDDLNALRLTVGYGIEQTFNAQENEMPIEQDPSGRPTEPAGPPPGCCACGSITCCSNPGKCLDCGNCGKCCRSAQ
jgi:hypothetical protein